MSSATYTFAKFFHVVEHNLKNYWFAFRIKNIVIPNFIAEK